MRILLPLYFVAVAGPASVAWANVPAAYFACEGAQEGESCRLVGGTFGGCVLDTLCEDDAPETPVNECLLCVDPCWGQAEGTSCVQLTGELGVCRLQDRCTDRPETSFVECNRCVDGDPDRTAASEGCQASDTALVFPWMLLLGLAWWERRSRAADGRA